MKTKQSFQFLSILCLMSIAIFSCNTEEITDSFDSENQNINFQSKALEKEASNKLNTLFYTDSIVSKEFANSRRANPSNNQMMDNNLMLCGDINNLGDVSIVTSWDIFNTGPGYIDYELEQLFRLDCEFSASCIRFGTPPTETVFGEVFFQETGSFNPMTGGFDIYEYLNGTISTEKANELKDHFACAIKEYREENLPNSFIKNIDFFGDASICTGCNGRFLRATFILDRH